MGKNHLECRECKKEYEPTFKYICDECFGPLDVKYDFPSVNKDTFRDREKTYWRYFELLPIVDKKNIIFAFFYHTNNNSCINPFYFQTIKLSNT